MPDNIEVPKEGLYVSTIPGGERLVVVDVNVVEDDKVEEGDEIFFLVTLLMKVIKTICQRQVGNSTPLNGRNILRGRN